VVSDRLKQAILEQLELDDWDITDTTTASMVPGWDSLSHVKIISAVESAFKVRFQTMEVIRLRTVGELQTLIDRKLTK
jgi:acyl carrier protein